MVTKHDQITASFSEMASNRRLKKAMLRREAEGNFPHRHLGMNGRPPDAAALTVFDRNAKYGDVPSVLDPDKQLDGVNEVSQPPVGKLHRSLIPRQRSEGLSIVIFVKPCRYSLCCDPPLNLADTRIGLQITRKLTRAVWFLTWARIDPRREHTAITGMHRLWQLLKLEETGVAIDSIGCRKDIARENLEWELMLHSRPNGEPGPVCKDVRDLLAGEKFDYNVGPLE
jgi:hypothetical protein